MGKLVPQFGDKPNMDTMKFLDFAIKTNEGLIPLFIKYIPLNHLLAEIDVATNPVGAKMKLEFLGTLLFSTTY